jgi:hypothetical protein
VSRATERGFKPPLVLEFRDANGNGFTQNLCVDDTGTVIDFSEPEFLDGTTGREPIVQPCTYTLTDSASGHGVEVQIDPKDLN